MYYYYYYYYYYSVVYRQRNTLKNLVDTCRAVKPEQARRNSVLALRPRTPESASQISSQETTEGLDGDSSPVASLRKVVYTCPSLGQFPCLSAKDERAHHHVKMEGKHGRMALLRTEHFEPEKRDDDGIEPRSSLCVSTPSPGQKRPCPQARALKLPEATGRRTVQHSLVSMPCGLWTALRSSLWIIKHRNLGVFSRPGRSGESRHGLPFTRSVRPAMI